MIFVAVYRLIEQLVFPPVELAEPEGLLAIGGDLSPQRLLLAYSSGIFPWYNNGDPILWWSPDPRCVLFPADLKVSRSLAKLLRRQPFEITFNRSFRQVMTVCGELRQQQGDGTWITEEMIEAYCHLHELGFAHSVESWQDGELVGGLYGVCLGRCFFGESMFHTVSNASKIAFVTLVRRLEKLGYRVIDCQQTTSYLLSMGATEIPRAEFLQRLRQYGVTPSSWPVPSPFPL